MTEPAARIAKAILQTFDVEPAQITPDACLRELGADDLDLLQLVMNVEDAFDIEITDAEAESLKTVGDIVRLIESKMAEAA